MATETTKPMSRRQLLAAVAAGVAAGAAGTLAGAQRVLAAGDDGKTIVIGETYDDVRSETSLATAGGTPVLSVDNGDPNVGVGSAGVRLAPSRRKGITAFHRSLEGRRSEDVTIVGGDKAIVTVTGAAGFGGSRAAIHARSDTGVIAIGHGGPGIRATGLNRGAVLEGRKAQARLKPSTRSNHPRSGKRGDLFVDKGGRLWYCKGGRQWRKLAS